jgi:hypothetical protein
LESSLKAAKSANGCVNSDDAITTHLHAEDRERDIAHTCNELQSGNIDVNVTVRFAALSCDKHACRERSGSRRRRFQRVFSAVQEQNSWRVCQTRPASLRQSSPASLE